MAMMPGATNRLLPNASRTRMSAHDIVCIHTMVGSLAGTDAYFRRLTNGVNSHFGTGGGGEIYQWVDTTFRSGANYNGNHHIISIENADMGPGFAAWNTNDDRAVPAFTAAQIEANARIIAWACKTYNIPCELIPDARPGRRGVGYHRQGVPGYMVAGAEQWSSSRGKVCPADRRIAQIPQIINRARQILGGAPIDEGDFLMALPEGDQFRIRDILYDAFWDGKSGAVFWEKAEMANRVRRIDANLQLLVGDTSDGGDRLADIWVVLHELKAKVEAPEDVDVNIDVDALADRLVQSFGNDVGQKVVDAMAARLQKA